MMRNWNFVAGIRKLTVEKFISNCQSINDIKYKLDTLNINHAGFPWEAASLLISNRMPKQTIDIVEEPHAQEAPAVSVVINVESAVETVDETAAESAVETAAETTLETSVTKQKSKKSKTKSIDSDAV